MDLGIVLENIERLLRVKKISAHKASTLAGRPDAIRNIQRKLKGGISGDGVSHKILEDLARVLGTSPEELQRPAHRIIVRPVTGLREALLAKIAWLDNERERALQELEALNHAETGTKKATKSKSSR